MGNRYNQTLAFLRKHANQAKVDEYIEKRGGQAQLDARYPVLDCNWNTVATFVQLSSDWTRIGLNGHFQGIPSPAIQSVLTLSGRTLEPEEFEGLKLMERTAKPILNQALTAR